ncbi:plasmid partitioning protein RepB [Brucella gallinifaecis]|uniref:plasmid partitioning protein RepB n=1 Tax=Brucella gallinifaecis TaxID=215590 RepID=UPI002362E1A8|nr:plasmid partitioning protein RepB [Brucella gallinifaecis]
MARKNLLEGLLPKKLSDDNSAPEEVQIPEHASSAFSHKGAIGAVSRSIQQLRSSSVSEIDPDLIDEPFVSDRLEESEESFAEFAAQIRDHGQQVPILVRPHPDKEGRYQVAYGRRRLRAIKLAGKFIKATVRPLSDDELIVAQGQENNARQDLSYIEKALYAVQLERNGFKRDIIMSALAIDKAALSHMISTAARIPDDIIRKIGSAPKAGRDRWIKIASYLTDEDSISAVRAFLDGELKTLSSDERFVRVFQFLKPLPQNKKVSPVKSWKSKDSSVTFSMNRKAKKISIELTETNAVEFGDWISTRLDHLYDEFEQSRTTKTGD